MGSLAHKLKRRQAQQCRHTKLMLVWLGEATE